MKVLTFNNTILTDQTIKKTEKWFYENNMACIEEVKSGKVFVNDQEFYFKWKNDSANEYLNGTYQITLTFLQRAYYIQTGESIALLA